MKNLRPTPAIVILFTLIGLFVIASHYTKPDKTWSLKSIDTMKHSRDYARQSLDIPNVDKIIDKQIVDIASTGATHVAIGTPYDAEFLPILKLWVSSARKHNINVFFRGNMAGWEEWFGYEKIDRDTHTKMIESFIEENEDLFTDGDIFSSCPECENGEKLDRDDNLQMEEYKQFLINEYKTTKNSFKKINKNVASNYYSMNGDIAFRLMDRETTRSFDGLIVIDHYVKDTEKLVSDIESLAEKSGGKIVLGEIGAPIPDIHGEMSEQEQKIWLQDVLSKISLIPNVVGINYWVNKGGSTALWRDNNQPKPAVETITNFYKYKNM